MLSTTQIIPTWRADTSVRAVTSRIILRLCGSGEILSSGTPNEGIGDRKTPRYGPLAPSRPESWYQLLAILQRKGIPEWMAQFVASFTQGRRTRIAHPGHLGEWISTSTGIPHGFPLSPRNY